MHIFVAGFQHETNTFAPTKADWAAFESGSAFPAFSTGFTALFSSGTAQCLITVEPPMLERPANSCFKPAEAAISATWR